MSLKEKFQSLSPQKKNTYYWVGVILMIDLALIVQNSISFTQTGECRNYMMLGSAAHACSALEFVKSGWAWLSFMNVLVFLPAVATMVFATQIVDIIFAKKQG
jgi:hypothetical protein